MKNKSKILMWLISLFSTVRVIRLLLNHQHFQWIVGTMATTAVLNDGRKIWMSEAESMFDIIVGPHLKKIYGLELYWFFFCYITYRDAKVAVQSWYGCGRLCANVIAAYKKIACRWAQMGSSQQHFPSQVLDDGASTLKAIEKHLQLFQSATLPGT